MDKLTITISYRSTEEGEDKFDADDYGAGRIIGKASVLVLPISDGNQAILANKILSDGHATVVDQQGRTTPGFDARQISAKIVDELKKRGFPVSFAEIVDVRGGTSESIGDNAGDLGRPQDPDALLRDEQAKADKRPDLPDQAADEANANRANDEANADADEAERERDQVTG